DDRLWPSATTGNILVGFDRRDRLGGYIAGEARGRDAPDLAREHTASSDESAGGTPATSLLPRRILALREFASGALLVAGCQCKWSCAMAWPVMELSRLDGPHLSLATDHGWMAP